ncbi:MAG TPA: hypothetical protein PKY82_34645, partial [Pyrinomonadaceae bacterium]|nr:hypothetical protein [Pyrinomonadaceae bacterium]
LLVFGESVDSETPVVEIYNEQGQFLTRKTYQTARDRVKEAGEYLLSASFTDVKWVSDTTFVAVLDKKIFYFNLEQDTVKRIYLNSLGNNEVITNCLPTNRGSVIIGTNFGLIDEISLKENSPQNSNSNSNSN